MSGYLFVKLTDSDMENARGREDERQTPPVLRLGPPITLKKHICLRHLSGDDGVEESGD